MFEANKNVGENNVVPGEALCPTERKPMKKAFSLWRKVEVNLVKQRKTRLEFFFPFSSLELQVVSRFWGTANFLSPFFLFVCFEQVLPFWYISRVESDGGDSSYKPALRNQYKAHSLLILSFLICKMRQLDHTVTHTPSISQDIETGKCYIWGHRLGLFFFFKRLGLF